MAIDTAMYGKDTGSAKDMMALRNKPQTAPAIGPSTTAARIVPIESNQKGIS